MENTEKKNDKRPEERTKKHIKTMDVILVIVGIALLAFTIAMIRLFKEYGSVPDTLVTCVFAALGGECGIMGWIKTTKDRAQERQWKQEDKQAAEPEAPEDEPQEDEDGGTG